jgi:hypothetical protein
MKTGTEALSSRLLSEPLPDSLILPSGTAWPQSRSDVAKHPELELLGTRRGAEVERRLEKIVADARRRDVPEVTILLIAEALNVAQFPEYIIDRLRQMADSLEVVFFARAQSAALLSFVAHRVQSWTSPTYIAPEFAIIVRATRKRFYYDVYASRWSGDHHTLTILPFYEDDRSTDELMKRFSRHTGIHVPEATKAKRANASLGKEQLVRLGELKQKLSRLRSIPVLEQLAAWLYFSARRRIQNEAQGNRWALKAGERREIIERYRESNARFKKFLGSESRRDMWKRWFAELEAPPRK